LTPSPWANDNKPSSTPQRTPFRNGRISFYRHTVGTAGPDTLVYEEKDERFDIGAGKTASKAYLLLISGSHTTSEARYIPADKPMAEWKIMERRKQDVEYYPGSQWQISFISA